FRSVDKFKILIGYYNLTQPTSNSVVVLVKSYTIHPSYSSDTNFGDIAVVELKHPVNFTNYIQPICVPSSNETFPGGKMCWVTGWGDIQSG
ncbi:serine protease 27-like, partial [Pelobates cultripes]